MPVEAVILAASLFETESKADFSKMSDAEKFDADTLVSAAVQLVRMLGKDAWAEGLNTPSQADLARAHAVTLGSGEHIGPALDHDRATALIGSPLPVAV